MNEGEENIIEGNKVLVVNLREEKKDLGEERSWEIVEKGNNILIEDINKEKEREENIKIIEDLIKDIVKIIGKLIEEERGEEMKKKIENGERMLLGEVIGIVLVKSMERIVDKKDKRRKIEGGKEEINKMIKGSRRVGRKENEGDKIVNIGKGNRKKEKKMREIKRIVEKEIGKESKKLIEEGEEGEKNVEKSEMLRIEEIKRKNVEEKRGMKRSIEIKMVKKEIGKGIEIKIKKEEIELKVRLIEKIGNEINEIVEKKLGNIIDNRGIVKMIGNIGDDNGIKVEKNRIDCGEKENDEREEKGSIGGIDKVEEKNDKESREIGKGNKLNKLRKLDGRIVDKRKEKINELEKIVRRNIGGNEERNKEWKIEEKVREEWRKKKRIMLEEVIIVMKIEGVIVDIRKEGLSEILKKELSV